MEDREDEGSNSSTQKVVHVHKNQSSKTLFEIGGYKITTDLVMAGVTGVSSAIAVALLINEVNRRKADQQNATTLQAMQERINALMEVPNANIEPIPGQEGQLQEGQGQVNQEMVVDNNNNNNAIPEGRYSDNSNYYDTINQGELSSSSNVNLNTINPYMDNVSDLAESKARQQEIYNRQRKYYNYNIPSNPWKTQHIITSQEGEYDTQDTSLPSSGINQANPTANGIRQAPSAGSKNMFVGRDGVVRRVQPRPEIAINLA